MRKKILFVNRYTLLDPLVETLVPDHEVVILEPRQNKYEPLRGAKTIYISYRDFGLDWFIHRFLKSQLSLPLWVVGLSRILKEEKPDTIVIFDFFHFILWQVLQYKKENRRVKIVLISETKRTPQNVLARSVFGSFLRLLKTNITQIENILVFTTAGREWFGANVSAGKISLIHVPVDTHIFTPPPLSRTWLPNKTLRIIMNARYVAYKRHEDLLQAMRRLSSGGLSVILTCIGREGEGQERVSRMATEIGLSSAVRFMQPVPQQALASIYHEHDVLVLPSDNEAIGMVVPEAMACGLLTITSDTVGANEYVQNGETGLIFKTGDVAALVDVLTQCYDATMLARMSVNARQRVEQHFTKDALAQSFKDGLDIS